MIAMGEEWANWK